MATKELTYTVKLKPDAASVNRTASSINKSVDKATKGGARSVKNLTSATKSYKKAQGSANQTLFSFGDLLNDSQQFQFSFAQGTQAIGNNIGFAAEQFSNVTNKAGGFKGGLKALGSSLLGPGGLILAINAVVTAITLFSNRTSEAEKEVTKFKDAASGEILDGFSRDNLSGKITALEAAFDEVTGLTDATEKIRAATDENALSLDNLAAEYGNATQKQRTFSAVSDQTNGSLVNQTKVLEQARADLLAESQQADEAIAKIIEKRLNEARATELVRRKLKELGLVREEQLELEEGELELPGIGSDIRGFAQRQSDIVEQEQQKIRSARQKTLDQFDRDKQLELKREVENARERIRIEREAQQSIQRLQSQAANAKVAAEARAINALRSLQQQFASDNKALALGILAAEKALAISNVVVDATQKAAAATATGFSLLANPATAPLAANAFAQAGAIKTAAGISIAAIAAQGLAEGAGILSSGGGSGGGGVASGAPSPSTGAGTREGFQTTETARNGAAATSMSGRGQKIEINLRGELDDRLISIKADQGRKRREGKAVVI